MKLTHLEVGRFGVWRDLSLPLTSSELNVIFGPNEAGKTTLMRFLRGMLFGFSRGDSFDSSEPPQGAALATLICWICDCIFSIAMFICSI